jgi:(1->4)-alpha-D-glucan 1-alpha-D-glucosylmutase
VVGFLRDILKPASDNFFLSDLLKFERKMAPYGMINGLAQVLVKMTSPGVPDFYQGCDLWDLRLVDPDNRGPVDFTHRAALLGEIEKRSKEDALRFTRELVQNWHDGRIKLYLIWKVLNLRRTYARVFLDGRFQPIETTGKRRRNLITYVRRKGDTWFMTVVPRWLARSKAPLPSAGFEAFWAGSHIVLPGNAPRSWLNVLTEETVRSRQLPRGPCLSLPDIFKSFPVAVLSGDSRPS